jgi:perosamine synthetase
MDSTTSKTIPVAAPLLDGNERKYVMECLDTTWISSGGRFIGEFEAEVARVCGARFGVATNNGTTALHLALAALGIGPGDEVIMPSLTYIATANTVRYCGGTPVFVDSETDTFNLDPAQIEARITSRTKAILPVHLYGHPADMDPIMEIAKRRGLIVVEDAAEALGALYKDRHVGSIGTCAAFSFFGNKMITTGEGGMIVHSDEALDAQMRLLRSQGMDPKRRYWHPVIGFNYRMTNVAAAIGLGQVERVERHLAARRRVAAWYDKHLASIGELVRRPITRNWARHAYWMYTILLEPRVRADRDDIMRKLAQHGIETRPVFYPMHQMPPYHEPDGKYPVADHLAARGMNLPTHAQLTEDDVVRVARALGEVVKS